MSRLGMLGIVVAGIGFVFVLLGVYAFTEVQAGYDSLRAFSDAQNITLNYNDDGELIDRGETEGAEAIMELLTEEWGFDVRNSEFDPDDPVMNTGSEYMYQMATIAYHVMHGTQTVVLDETTEYEGETFEKGEHEFDVDGRYWTGFDRMHPIEGPARGQAWTGTAHGLIAELGVGAVIASTLELGRALSLIVLAFGFTLGLLGVGLIWAGHGLARQLEPAG